MSETVRELQEDNQAQRETSLLNICIKVKVSEPPGLDPRYINNYIGMILTGYQKSIF